MNSRVVVTVIIKKGDQFLLGLKPKGVGPYPDTWHLLGGGVNLEEETLEEAVRREILEEAGIEIKDIEKDSFQEDYEKNKHGEITHYLYLVYWAKYKSGEVKAQDDVYELKWFKKADLKKVPLTRPTLKRFKELNLL